MNHLSSPSQGLTSLIIIINTEFIIISVIFIIITVVTVALNLGKQIGREDLTWQDVLVTACIFLEKRRWIGWIARIPRYSSFSHTRPHEHTHTDTNRHTGTHTHKTHTHRHTHTGTHAQKHTHRQFGYWLLAVICIGPKV